MSKTKHTPAPWHVGTPECRSEDAVFGPVDGVPGVDVGVIAQCGAVARPHAENFANARLIAAAPALLAACKAVAEWFGANSPEDEEVLKQVCAAIDQAERH